MVRDGAPKQAQETKRKNLDSKNKKGKYLLNLLTF